mgnify:CR=1 FL=1
MSPDRRTIIPRRGGSKRSSTSLVLLLLAACAMIPGTYLAIQGVINPTRERLDHQLRQVEAAIRDNEAALEKLAFHDRRLASAADDSQSHRIPVLVQGRSTYVTVDASGLGEVSRALALEDLLMKHHRKLKGDFRSGDAAEWKSVLVEISNESRNHLRTTELPALHKRMEEIRQETAKLELRRMSLQKKSAKATH